MIDRARLDQIIRSAQGRGLEIEPQTQRELILHRIASGNGKPVPLPEVQQGQGGTFVSDPQARICELRKLYLIECRTTRIAGQKHSTYSLKLNPDGTPKTKADIFRPSEPKPVQAAQQNIFRDLADVQKFCAFETGGKR